MAATAASKLRIEHRWTDTRWISGEWRLWSVCRSGWDAERAEKSVARLRRAYPRKYEFRLVDASQLPTQTEGNSK